VKADRPQKHKARADFSGIYRALRHLLFVLGCRVELEDCMRSGAKRILSVLAAYAVALHAVLWVAAAPFAPAAVDPLTVICRSEAGAAGDRAPANAPLAPAHACDHCNLCSAVAPPVPDTAVADYFAPVRTLEILRPVSPARRAHANADPKLARGPPVFA
jgi:hypothetical protein